MKRPQTERSLQESRTICTTPLTKQNWRPN